MPPSPSEPITSYGPRRVPEGSGTGASIEAWDSTRAVLATQIQIGKQPPQVLDLRGVVVADVGIVRVPGGVVLVIGFGGIETGELRDLGRDRTTEGANDVGLREVGPRDPF